MLRLLRHHPGIASPLFVPFFIIPPYTHQLNESYVCVFTWGLRPSKVQFSLEVETSEFHYSMDVKEGGWIQFLVARSVTGAFRMLLGAVCFKGR